MLGEEVRDCLGGGGGVVDVADVDDTDVMLEVVVLLLALRSLNCSPASAKGCVLREGLHRTVVGECVGGRERLSVLRLSLILIMTDQTFDVGGSSCSFLAPGGSRKYRKAEVGGPMQYHCAYTKCKAERERRGDSLLTRGGLKVQNLIVINNGRKWLTTLLGQTAFLLLQLTC